MKIFLAFALSIFALTSLTQKLLALESNKIYPNLLIGNGSDLNFALKFKNGEFYKTAVQQQEDVMPMDLSGHITKELLEIESSNWQYLLGSFDYQAGQTWLQQLAMKRLTECRNASFSQGSNKINEFSKLDSNESAALKKGFIAENSQTIQTLDIDHFWDAFDKLQFCKSKADSISIFQQFYLDRATSGLEDFMRVRNFTAEKFVLAVAKFPKFYRSIRSNTLAVKKAIPEINEMVKKFESIYPDFRWAKICFAIGVVSTGGTVSEQFLLIGTEIATATKDIDLSEFKNSPLSKVLANGDDPIQKIKNFVAHEYVHTQQLPGTHKKAIRCDLLYAALQEGICDFIGEMIAGNQINVIAQEYGNRKEKELWREFKSELCNESLKNWLYNYTTVKDRPADLGYYIGYQIAKSYYENAGDKKQAVIDIIRMNDPIAFLQASEYDQKPKN